MTTVWIAHNTFREATRDRIVAGMTIAGIAFMGVVQVLTPLALGEEKRLVVDLGLSAISMLGLLMVLLAGTSLVAKEIERKTIYGLLSRPIARPAYLIGKWAGLTAAAWVIAAALGAALTLAMILRGSASFAPALAQAAYLAALELGVITAIAVLFSALSTPILSALYTVGFYCVGQWSYDLRVFAGQFPPALAQAIEFMATVVPNLPLFNMRSMAAEGIPTSAIHLGVATGYAVLYCACVLALAAAAFESRDFK